MGASKFQEYWACRLQRAAPHVDFYKEWGCRDQKNWRIDLGTLDYRYGVEIKSGMSDLHSGYGLNQERFTYPYLLIDGACVRRAEIYLRQKEMYRTGIICIMEDRELWIVKCAKGNKWPDLYFSSADELLMAFVEQNRVLEVF